MKIVINRCYGGFGLSERVHTWLIARGLAKRLHDHIDCWAREERSNPLLVECVEALGDEANGLHARLRVVEIPDDVDWEIEDRDGMETVRERSRSWSS